ncbi:MAG: hypothetical protein OHK0052_24280 [Anaerolineales bacterium]
MKKFLPFVLVVLALLFSSMACSLFDDIMNEDNFVTEEVPVAPAQDSAEPADTVETTLCTADFDAMLAAQEAEPEDPADLRPEWGAADEEGTYLVTYTVDGNEIIEPVYEDVPDELMDAQADEANHAAIWETFTAIIPASGRQDVAEFAVMTDGVDNTLAAVSQTTYDPNLWLLEVDVADAENTPLLIATLVHEYAHLLTLGPAQVEPSEAIFNNPDDDAVYFDEQSACPRYFPGEGCPKAGAYIDAFYQQFWDEIYAEWQDVNLIEDEDAYYEALDEFYYAYEDWFVSDYAATNPEEDIAETFMFFVLAEKPAGDTIAEEKILFFYEYPELVRLRQQIRSGICRLN